MRIVLALVGILALASAHASVINGNIYQVIDNAGSHIGSTVDYWQLNVNSAGPVTIDTLSWESDDGDVVTADGFSEAVDVNGDGEIAFLDTMMYLFFDDGSLDLSDFIAVNDDDFTNTYGDGSIFGFDAYISQSLNAGSYVLAIGAYSLNMNEAIAGLNNETYYPRVCTSVTGDCESEAFDHGDYRITFTGDLTVQPRQVPEPASLSLLVIGLASLGFKRRACVV